MKYTLSYPVVFITALASAKVAIPPPPKKSAARNAVIRFMGVWLKNRISEGYNVALFHPIDLKFGMYTRLGVLDSRLKFQVSISSRTGVTGGSHLLKIQCNMSARARA